MGRRRSGHGALATGNALAERKGRMIGLGSRRECGEASKMAGVFEARCSVSPGVVCVVRA